MKEQSKRQPKQEQTESSSHITYQGKKYEYNGNLRTLLFLGVDKDEEVTVKETTGRERTVRLHYFAGIRHRGEEDDSFRDLQRYYGRREDIWAGGRLFVY
ncbi:MAG: hypothetical protein ACLRMN_02675 [Mediterraneibacter gnavus]